MPDSPGAHLDDEEGGRGGDAAHGQRHSDLTVERVDRRHRLATRGEHGGEQVFGARLARGAGDGDHAHVGSPVEHRPRQVPEGELDVVDDDTGQVVERAGGQRGDRPGGGRGRGVRVAVGELADACDVEPAGAALA